MTPEVPEDRTCETAGIPDAFCSCHRMEELDMDMDMEMAAGSASAEKGAAKVARAGATAMVQEINKALKKYSDICSKWKLKKLLKVRKKVKKNHFMIRVGANPTDNANNITAIFEGWVREQKNRFQIKLNDVSRLDLYGLTSQCILNKAYHSIYCLDRRISRVGKMNQEEDLHQCCLLLNYQVCMLPFVSHRCIRNF